MFINNTFPNMAEFTTSKSLVFVTLGQPNKSYGTKIQKWQKAFMRRSSMSRKMLKIGSFPPQSSNFTFPKTNLSMILVEDVIGQDVHLTTLIFQGSYQKKTKPRIHYLNTHLNHE